MSFGARSGLSRVWYSWCVINSIAALILINACSTTPPENSPAWVAQAAKNGDDDIYDLSHKLAGHWVLNESLSDDVEMTVDRFFKKGMSRKRGPAKRDELGRPSIWGADRNPAAPPELDGGLSRLKRDPRLVALLARELDIKLVGQTLVYHYSLGVQPEGPSESRETAYPIDGEPISNDGNINIAFAEWEHKQFIIERNGPRGRILEYWTPSPDASQLHLQIQIATTVLPDAIVINRLFDAR